MGCSAETRTIVCFSNNQQGESMGLEMCCLALRPGLTRFREELVGDGRETSACMDDVYLSRMWGTANTVGVFSVHPTVVGCIFVFLPRQLLLYRFL